MKTETVESPVDERALEGRIVERGTALFERIRADKPSVFDRSMYTGKMMEWAMEDAAFRTQLFRFVDVLPSLSTSADLMRHVQAYFGPVAGRLPGLASWGLGMNPEGLAAKATAALVRRQVETMARQFITGTHPRDALKRLHRIRRDGFAFTVDLLGEACVSEAEAATYAARYDELLTTLAKEVPQWRESAPLIEGHPGDRSPVHISVKLSALYPHVKAVAYAHSVRELTRRLGRICAKAREVGAYVCVDMEDTAMTDITLGVIKSLLGSDEFKDWRGFGCVLQAYLRRTEDDLGDLIAWLEETGTYLSVRLVKGAYWDTETIRARLDNWPVPVWTEKSASDAAYERLSRRMLDAPDHIYPAFASHNIRSLCHALAYADARGRSVRDFEIQALYGMADPIKRVFAAEGYLVREYTPVGELIPGMAYLVRRLLENTSNKGFIRQGFHEGANATELLAKPIAAPETESPPPDPTAAFANCPFLDFSHNHHREAFTQALQEWKQEHFPLSVKPFGLEKGAAPGASFESVSPEDPQIVVARVQSAPPNDIPGALRRLSAAVPAWRSAPVQERVAVLRKTADLLAERRYKLAALIVWETGKPWAETDGDVAEAIDFCRYYADAAEDLFKQTELCPLEGEDDMLIYEGRGVCAVIGPWNFPAAIPCGMFAAALVTGNAVALKPAEQAPAVARFVFDCFLEAGMPPDVAAFLPGDGPTGAALVDSPLVQTIAFTGSRAVGFEILRKAAEIHPDQTEIKRVIAEMGGKNAIIIDGDADLDQAVKGVVSSAFGYAGQKCSACSRVIVVEAAYERFLERLIAAVKSLPIGPSSDPRTVVGPLIEAEAVQRLEKAALAPNARLLAEAPLPTDLPSGGYYVAPRVFEVRDAAHPHFREEYFGPFVALLRVPTFDAALAAANDSAYALTGGVFSRHPENLTKAARSFRVGNLYLNRNCTGALVGRQPFGGFRFSGVGSKAGGADYLKQFVLPRVITENTLRQGFAPLTEAD